MNHYHTWIYKLLYNILSSIKLTPFWMLLVLVCSSLMMYDLLVYSIPSLNLLCDMPLKTKPTHLNRIGCVCISFQQIGWIDFVLALSYDNSLYELPNLRQILSVSNLVLEITTLFLQILKWLYPRPANGKKPIL